MTQVPRLSAAAAVAALAIAAAGAQAQGTGPRAADGWPGFDARLVTGEDARDGGPPAATRQGNGSVVLPGRGHGFVAAEFLDTEITYEVRNLTGEDIHSDTRDGAGFEILSNRPFTLDVAFPTWRPAPPAPQDVRQAAFSDGAHRIGGRLWLEFARGGSPDGEIIFQSPDGRLEAAGPRGRTRWALGADIAARHTDHPSGLAAAGVYSLEAVITIQPF